MTWKYVFIDSQLVSRCAEGILIALGCLVGCWLIARKL